MTPTAGEVAALLIGMLLGAGSVMVAGWVVLGFNVWRQGRKEGTQLVGEEFERNRRRETP